MPLPVAHSLAGVAIFKGLDADGTSKAWKRLALAVIIANVPDLDLLPGLIVGEPDLLHHVGPSHSAVFAIFAGVVVGVLAAAAGRRWPVVIRRATAVQGTALMVALCLLSHVVLDAFTSDFRPPGGVPMWWPISNVYVEFYPWFFDAAKLVGRGSPLDFVGSVLAVHNLYAMLWEFVTLAPVIALVAWWRARRTGDGSEFE